MSWTLSSFKSMKILRACCIQLNKQTLRGLLEFRCFWRAPNYPKATNNVQVFSLPSWHKNSALSTDTSTCTFPTLFSVKGSPTAFRRYWRTWLKHAPSQEKVHFSRIVVGHMMLLLYILGQTTYCKVPPEIVDARPVYESARTAAC